MAGLEERCEKTCQQSVQGAAKNSLDESIITFHVLKLEMNHKKMLEIHAKILKMINLDTRFSFGEIPELFVKLFSMKNLFSEHLGTKINEIVLKHEHEHDAILAFQADQV